MVFLLLRRISEGGEPLFASLPLKRADLRGEVVIAFVPFFDADDKTLPPADKGFVVRLRGGMFSFSFSRSFSWLGVLELELRVRGTMMCVSGRTLNPG